MFKQRFENGDDMNGFLSTLIFDAEKIDYLRYTWHIYHFHLFKTVFKEIDNMIPGNLSPKIITSKDIYDLYRHKLNVCFEFEGKGYMSLEHSL